MLIGVISDTHGRLPEAVYDAFAGVEYILHAGDIGGPDILWELNGIAPVTAVLGNNDYPLPGWDLAPLASVRLAGVRFIVGHIERLLLKGRDLQAEDVRVVVSGHTHVARVSSIDGVLRVNPGSPTRSRGCGHTVALAEVVDGHVNAWIVEIQGV